MDEVTAQDVRPRIGVLVSLATLGLGSDVDAMAQQFTDRATASIEAAGGVPEVIDISAPTCNVDELPQRFDGLVILGLRSHRVSCASERIVRSIHWG